MKEEFQISTLKSKKSYISKIRYCNDTLKFLGEGCFRVAYLLPNNLVLKLAKNKEGKKDNKREYKICRQLPKEHKKNVLKVYFVAKDGLYSISERLFPFEGNEFKKIRPDQITYTKFEKQYATLGYGWKVKLSPQQKNKILRLQKTTNYLRDKFNISDFENDGNWRRRKNGDVVILDFSYGYTSIRKW